MNKNRKTIDKNLSVDDFGTIMSEQVHSASVHFKNVQNVNGPNLFSIHWNYKF